jgi:hypothetical protein
MHRKSLIKLNILVPLARFVKAEASLDKHNDSEQNIHCQVYCQQYEDLGLVGFVASSSLE